MIINFYENKRKDKYGECAITTVGYKSEIPADLEGQLPKSLNYIKKAAPEFFSKLLFHALYIFRVTSSGLSKMYRCLSIQNGNS